MIPCTLSPVQPSKEKVSIKCEIFCRQLCATYPQRKHRGDAKTCKKPAMSSHPWRGDLQIQTSVATAST